MITAGLIRLIVFVVVMVGAAYEAGSPLITRVQLDGVAADTAQEARRVYERTRSARLAREAAEKEATEAGATLIEESFAITRDGGVALTVQRTAPSIVLDKWDRTKSYYDVRVDGLSEKGRDL